MEKLIATIQRGKPFFDRLARNRYLKAIRDGFISAMPIVIFSSIFLLSARVCGSSSLGFDSSMPTSGP